MSERIIAHAQSIRSTLPHGIAVLVGVSGCQGSGKTYNANAAVGQLRAHGLRAIAISLDDYYLDYQSQQQLAARGNPLLEKRGLPGTHDVSALVQTLKALKQGKQASVLQYDKSQHHGAGDRIDPILVGPVDVIVLEGWMLGFNALGSQLKSKLKQCPHAEKYSLENLKQVDDNLATYKRVWNMLDALILMRASSLQNVYTWRLEQEHALIAQKGKGMTDQQIVSFVDGYMPAYELYLDGVQASEIYTLDVNREVVQG